MSLSNYKQSLYEAVLNLLWRQWSSLGVAGHTMPVKDDYAIDPEALLIFSAAFCRYDQRLYDLMASWLLKFGLLANPTRLKALLRKTDKADKASLAYLAALQIQAGDKRWASIEKECLSPEKSAAPLFITPNGETLSIGKEADSHARHYGFIRNPFIPPAKISRKLPESSATALLQLRGLMGVSARADILFQLMLHPCKVPQLETYCGFAQNAIRAVLAELQLANFVSPVNSPGKNTVYILSTPDEWKQYHVRHVRKPIHWAAIYNVLTEIWQLVSNPILFHLSQETIKGEQTLLFQKKLQPMLLNCGIEALEQLTADKMHTLPEILDTL